MTARLLFVHETYGRLAGAEQNILVTAPRLAQTFDLAFLHWQRSGRDEADFDTLFRRRYQVPFDQSDNAVRERTQQVLEQEQPDLVYVHKCISVGLLQALCDSGLPLVRMEHDHDIYCMRSYKYFPWTRRICRRRAGWHCVFPCLAFMRRDRTRGRFGIKYVSYRRQRELIRLNQRFDAIFVVTRYMRDELIRQGFDPARIHIFPPVPKPRTEPFESTFSDRNLIVYAGQIVRGKGVDCLIRAMALLKQPARLVVLGGGSHRPFCEKLVRTLGLADRVRFPGFVSQEQLADYYSNATMVVVPSVWPEPIATVGLEVMRYGLPVVAFDSGGISDWLNDGQNGFLVPWMDVEAMADRMDRLLADKKTARRMGACGRELVNSQFDFNDYINSLTTALCDLMS